MHVRAMVPSGATIGIGGFDRCKTDRLSCRRQSAPQQGKPGFVVGRSVLICAVLAAGFTACVLSLAENTGESPQQDATVVSALELLAPHVAPRAMRAKLVKASLTDDPILTNPGLRNGVPDRISPDDLAAILAPDVPHDPDEILAFGPVRIRRWLVETIVKAARETDSDPTLLMAIADKESSFSTTVQARTSSATGLFQFIEKTWLKVVKQFGAQHGLAAEAAAITFDEDGEPTIANAAMRTRILEMRRDPYVAALMAAEMLKRDSARIADRIGRDLTKGEVYIAHFLGPDDAERFMAKVVEAPSAVAAKLLPKPARANKPIFFARHGRRAKGLSVADVHQKFEDMIGRRVERYRDVPQIASAYAGGEDIE